MLLLLASRPARQFLPAGLLVPACAPTQIFPGFEPQTPRGQLGIGVGVGLIPRRARSASYITEQGCLDTHVTYSQNSPPPHSAEMNSRGVPGVELSAREGCSDMQTASSG